MQIENPKIGGLIRINGQIGEIIDISKASGIRVRTLNHAIVSLSDSDNVVPIFLGKKLLTECCGFSRNGILKIPLDNEHVFYLKENNGHIILLGKNMDP